MKYKLLFILLAMMLQVTTIIADDEVPTAELTFVVDDAERVAISVSGSELEDIQTGANTIEVMQWSNVTIAPKEGCILKSVVDSQNQDLAISNGTVSFMVYEAIPETYTITSEKVSEVHFTINVDDPDKVKVVDKNYQPINLNEGDNLLEMNALRFPLMIGAATYGQELYQVLFNDEEVAAYYGSYVVTPEENSMIKIMADFPDIDCSVNFTYPEGINNFFTAITADGREISDFSNGVEVKCGTNLALYFNPSCWDTDENPIIVKINGAEVQWFWSGYFFTVKDENTTVSVEQAQAVEMITVTVEVDNPWNIKLFRVDKEYRDRILLSKGVNTVELPKETANLIITNVETEENESKITGVTINGTPATISYYNEVELKDLEENDAIKIFTEGEFGEETPYGSEITAVPSSGETLESIISVTLYLEPTFDYDDETDLFEINNPDGIYFTLNGERLCGASTNIDVETLLIWPEDIIYVAGEYELVIEKGAISWIKEEGGDYIASEEVLSYRYNVEGINTNVGDMPFTLTPSPSSSPVGTFEITMGLKEGYDELDVADTMTFIYQNGRKVCGVYADASDDYTTVTITPDTELESGEYALIFQTGAVTCVGDDYYYNMEPLVFYYTVGISSVKDIVASPYKNKGVYNMHGIKVADSPENLPAGIYIYDGKKIILK